MSSKDLELGFLFSVDNLSEFDPEKLSEKEEKIYIIGNKETQEEVQLLFIVDENKIAVSNYLGEDCEMKALTLSEIEELILKRKELLEGLGFSVNEDSAGIYYSHYCSGSVNPIIIASTMLVIIQMVIILRFWF